MFSDLMCISLFLRFKLGPADGAFKTGGMIELMSQQILLRFELFPTVLAFVIDHLHLLLNSTSQHRPALLDIEIE
jgi:hypothetical protein